MGKLIRLLAVVLAVVIFAGCSKANVNPGAQVTAPVENEDKLYPAGRSDIQCQRIPEKIKKEEGITVLKWVCLGATSSLDQMVNQIFGYGQDWSEEAVLSLNQALEEMGKPYRIQFVMFSTTNADEISWFRVPEVLAAMESADLITGPFTRKQMQNYLLPLTQYVETEAKYSLSGSVLHETNWVDTTVEGEIYGIPTAITAAEGSGWNIRKDALETLGIAPEVFQKEYWQMGEVFRALYERNGQQAFLLTPESGITSQKVNGVTALQPSAISYMLDNRYMPIGSCFAVDFSGEKPVVVNYLRTDYVRNIQQGMLSYAEAGYFTDDPAVHLLDYSNAFSDEVYTYNWLEEEIICVPVSGLHYVQTDTPRLTGILKESDHAEEALMLLSAMAQEEQLRDRLLLGEEGVDYTLEDGVYQALARKDGSYSMGFLSQLDAFATTSVFDLLKYPEKSGLDRVESYQQVMGAAEVWPVLSFDFSTLLQEEQAVRAVLKTYLADFASMTAEAYEQMLQEINRAGEEYIQAELQRQLDEWWKIRQN